MTLNASKLSNLKIKYDFLLLWLKYFRVSWRNILSRTANQDMPNNCRSNGQKTKMNDPAANIVVVIINTTTLPAFVRILERNYLYKYKANQIPTMLRDIDRVSDRKFLRHRWSNNAGSFSASSNVPCLKRHEHEAGELLFYISLFKNNLFWGENIFGKEVVHVHECSCLRVSNSVNVDAN